MAIAAPISPEHIAIVKATAPVLKEHGVTITSLFYKNMIGAHPELKNIFSLSNQASGDQPRALAAAVLAYATYVDDLGKLGHLVERIAHKHESLNVQPDQYQIVGKHLIEAVATVLGDACTPDIAEAWTAAYAALAYIFIGRERQLYAAHGDWPGWRRFRIARKEPETAAITSFYLEPEDGAALPAFLPGQYVSIQLFVPQLGHMQPRQYSLSEAPRPDYYRISVKREDGAGAGLPGLISNILHADYHVGDTLELSAPAGEFFIDPNADAEQPVVLISAGVGLTPMISIVNSATAAAAAGGPKRRISWIHGAHTAAARAFAGRVREAAAQGTLLNTTLFVTEPAAGDAQGAEYDVAGRIDLAKVDREAALFLGDARAEYYVCGPYAFMKDVEAWLVRAGVAEDRVHLEVFGTGDQ
ncbi:flavohemo protein [Durotheca rogersii]|uniref:flavohemo protein n=1 Tax=Durotheca rogersii TaxID=419775 RepID=UPI00221FB519|nr:flavohemo protein [Durotheca rogersii]KAI5864120.1 flavohemo protein [Durotheca rogersii]